MILSAKKANVKIVQDPNNPNKTKKKKGGGGMEAHIVNMKDFRTNTLTYKSTWNTNK